MADPGREIDQATLAELTLPTPSAESGKAGRGKLLIVAGSTAMPGPAILAARAALRVGCGTVRVAAPRSVAVAIGAAVPELLVVPLPETNEGTVAGAALAMLHRQFEPCDAAVIGPGLGEDEETDRLAVEFLAACPLPTVVDASSLLAWGRAGTASGAGPRVITPHAAEMARLLGTDLDAVDRDRTAVARDASGRWGAVVVLKGVETIVAGRGLYRNTAGTAGLGTAGSGDVLAGVIGGLLARGADPTVAAVRGVYLHALAGEAAEADYGDDGMIASDVVAGLPDALRVANVSREFRTG